MSARDVVLFMGGVGLGWGEAEENLTSCLPLPTPPLVYLCFLRQLFLALPDIKCQLEGISLIGSVSLGVVCASMVVVLGSGGGSPTGYCGGSV